jgi:hypothetical protein
MTAHWPYTKSALVTVDTGVRSLGWKGTVSASLECIYSMNSLVDQLFNGEGESESRTTH